MGFRPISGGGGAGFQLFIQSDNNQGIYSNAAARDAYFSANQDEVNRLANNEFLIIKLDDDGSGSVAYQQYSGATGSYVPADWVDVTSLIQGETGPAGATGNSYFFKSLADRDAFFTIDENHQLLETDLPVQVNTGENRVSVFVWRGVDNPAVYDSSQFELASVRSGTGSFYLADAHRISSSGENIAFENVATGVSYHPVWQTYDIGNTGAVRVRGDNVSVEVSDKTADLTNPVWSQPATSGDQTVISTIVDFTNAVTGLSISIEIDGVPFWSQVFGNIPSGEQTLTFNPPLDVRNGQVLTLTATASTGDVVVKGNSGTGQPYQLATIRLWEDKSIALAEDITHPITIARDMPSDEDLTALAAASVNGNSAVWEIANNQLSNSNRNGVNFTALVPGLLDIDGNEIPITPTSSDSLQLRAGTTVRIFSNIDLRVTTTPLFESDVSQDVVFVFDDLTINNTNLNTYNRKTLVCNLTGLSKTITIAQGTDIDYFDVFVGESTPLLVMTQGLERINDETDKRFTSNQGGRIKKMTAGGQYGIVYDSSNDLANGGITPTDADRIYYGLSQSDDTTTIDVTTLTREDDPTNPDTLSAGATSSGDHFVIFVPMTHDITSIFDTVLQQDVTTIFTALDNAQVIDTISFKSYIIGPLNADVNEQYVINF